MNHFLIFYTASDRSLGRGLHSTSEPFPNLAKVEKHLAKKYSRDWVSITNIIRLTEEEYKCYEDTQ